MQLFIAGMLSPRTASSDDDLHQVMCNQFLIRPIDHLSYRATPKDFTESSGEGGVAILQGRGGRCNGAYTARGPNNC